VSKLLSKYPERFSIDLGYLLYCTLLRFLHTFLLLNVFAFIALIKSFLSEVKILYAFAFRLAFIKRVPVIEADKPLAAQMNSITFTEDSPYDTLHSLVSSAFAPFFKSYVRESGKLDRYDVLFRKFDFLRPMVGVKLTEKDLFGGLNAFGGLSGLKAFMLIVGCLSFRLGNV